MPEKSKALARRIAEAAVQGKDAYLAAHDELFASDAVTHQIGMPEVGFAHVSRQKLNQPGFSLVVARNQPAPGWTSAVRRVFGT